MNTYITEWYTRTGMIFAGPRLLADSWEDAAELAQPHDCNVVGLLRKEAGGAE